MLSEIIKEKFGTDKNIIITLTSTDQIDVCKRLHQYKVYVKTDSAAQDSYIKTAGYIPVRSLDNIQADLLVSQYFSSIPENAQMKQYICLQDNICRNGFISADYRQGYWFVMQNNSEVSVPAETEQKHEEILQLNNVCEQKEEDILILPEISVEEIIQTETTEQPAVQDETDEQLVIKHGPKIKSRRKK